VFPPTPILLEDESLQLGEEGSSKKNMERKEGEKTFQRIAPHYGKCLQVTSAEGTRLALD
jgi:hypothetical protein